MKNKLNIILSAAVVLLVLLGLHQPVRAEGPAACLPTGTETVVTDKADYAPEETVHVSGSGYSTDCNVVVQVTRPDGSVVTGNGSFTPGSDTITTNALGNLAYDYILDGIAGTYSVAVLGEGSAVLAETTFTDLKYKIYADAATTTQQTAFAWGATVYSEVTRCGY